MILCLLLHEFQKFRSSLSLILSLCAEGGFCLDLLPHLVINQVFQRKTLVIKMMNVGGRAVGRAAVKNSFPEHLRNRLNYFNDIC